MSEPALYVLRGSQLEAIHHASIAVVNGEGKLTHYLGEPQSLFMTRSSIKPFQLRALLQNGGEQKYNLSSKQIAIMCGSHNGTDEHRQTVLDNLSIAGNDAEMLKCGSHRPMFMEIEQTYPKNNEHLDPLRHNCSGKHSGFLMLSRMINDDPAEYINPESKTQKLIKDGVANFCEYDLPEKFYGTDGCSAPNFPLPLDKLAASFVKLVRGEGEGESERNITTTIRNAMYEHPLMVSGERRIDYELSRSFPDNLICKIGAEAVEGIALREPEIGIAVKVSDGNFRALEPMIIETLRQLGIIDKVENYSHLDRFAAPEIKNVRNLVTGKIIADFQLKKA